MGAGKKRPTPRSTSGGKSRKPRANSRSSTTAKPNASKKRRLDGARPVTQRRVGPGLDVIDDFAAMRAMNSNNGNSAALRQMEVFEWIGDAVIGELVARCLLSQFHHSPLSARVFRNLRLGTVTNQNLASVFDLIGYQRHTVEGRKRKTKEKADVVEAVAGEIVIRLELQKRDERVCARLRSHLDAVVSAMLHQHFGERRRVHQKAVISGPLAVSFNAFDCLPQEDLDEETGELVISEGTMERIDIQIKRDTDSTEFHQKSFADLIEELEHDDKPRLRESSAPFHSLPEAVLTRSDSSGSFEDTTSYMDEHSRMTVAAIHKQIQLKLRLVLPDHVLRSSREIFDVFKIYGMTVLAERVSLALAFQYTVPNLAPSISGERVAASPKLLTTQRQSVLCMSNMERCAVLLGLATDGADDEEDHFSRQRLRANTLRAFVGYHSAIAAEDGVRSVADDVAYLLQLLADNDSIARASYSSAKPRREPLVVLGEAVNETASFMTSSVCADLHQPGERPQPTPTPKLLLRKCDSGDVEDLFATLARRSSAERDQLLQQTNPREAEFRNRRQKRKRSEDEGEAPQNHGKPTANLTRFTHRRFLFCLEELIVLFAQRKTEECRTKMSSFESDLEPCAGELFRKWEVSTSTLTVAMADSFYRLLLHDLCHFHALVSTSKNTRDGTRITQLRIPMHYTWAKIQRRVTTEGEATG